MNKASNMSSSEASCGPAFHHYQSLLGAGHDEIEAAFLELGEGGIDHELAVNLAHPHCGNGPLEGNVGNGQGCRSTVKGNDIRIILGVN